MQRSPDCAKPLRRGLHCCSSPPVLGRCLSTLVSCVTWQVFASRAQRALAANSWCSSPQAAALQLEQAAAARTQAPCQSCEPTSRRRCKVLGVQPGLHFRHPPRELRWRLSRHTARKLFLAKRPIDCWKHQNAHGLSRMKKRCERTLPIRTSLCTRRRTLDAPHEQPPCRCYRRCRQPARHLSART